MKLPFCVWILFLTLVLTLRLEATLSLHLPVPAPTGPKTTTSWTVPDAGLVLSEMTLSARRDLRSIAPMTTHQQQQDGHDHDEQYYETAVNVTLPLALTILAPKLFPSLSKARRLIRQKRILVIPCSTKHTINATTAIVGTSATRIYPGYVVSIPSLSNKSVTTKKDDTNSIHNTTEQQQQQRAGYPNLSYTKVPGLLPAVVYEDDDIAILHKLAGMICHSINKGGYDSNSILKMAPLVLTPPPTHHPPALDGTQPMTTPILKDNNNGNGEDACHDGNHDALPRPVLAHRLDTRTSGLLLMAKTRTASVSLSHQFATRQVLKTYHALVHGRPLQDEGIVESKIGIRALPISTMVGPVGGADDDDNDEDDNGGKVAITHYKVLKSIPTSKGAILSWVEFHPQTGRRHQLRQHAAYELSCPIVGDGLYGTNTHSVSSSSSPSSYMYLCSTRIACRHPRTNDWLDVTIPTPRRFHNFWEREQGRYDRYQQWLR